MTDLLPVYRLSMKEWKGRHQFITFKDSLFSNRIESLLSGKSTKTNNIRKALALKHEGI